MDLKHIHITMVLLSLLQTDPNVSGEFLQVGVMVLLAIYLNTSVAVGR